MVTKQFIDKYGKNKLLHPENSERLIDWMKGKNIPPITVMICPTDRCHHRCPKCVGARTGTENLQNMLGIIEQLADYGVKSLGISGGGEPLLNKETPKMVEFARSKGMDIGLITNGDVSIPDSEVVKIIKNTHWIRISIDGSNPKEYMHSHGMNENEFKRMLKNVKHLIEVRDKYNLTNCDIGVGYLTDKITKKGMLQATKMFKKMGLSYIQFRPFFNDKTSTDIEFAKCLKYNDSKFRVTRSEYRYDKKTQNSDNRGYKKCLCPYFQVPIAPSGKMYICCHTMGLKKYEIGNINKDSFKDIWEGKQRQKVMKSINFKDCPPICRWHTFNNLLFEIKDKQIDVNSIQQIVASRQGEEYKTVKIL